MTAPPEGSSLRRCFSTLGCADLSFLEICDLAREFRIPALELRGVSGRMDMPEFFAQSGLNPARMEEICRSRQTRIIVAGSSIKLASAAEKDRAELLAFGSWAHDLDIPYVRVFGGGTWGRPLTEAEYSHAVELIHWWRNQKATHQWRVELLLETHDAFSASEPCLALNARLAEPLPLIWDSHHTWRVGAEAPASTWNQIGALVRHVQIKDSVDRPSARHPYSYVLPGDGQMPLAEVIALLERERFEGLVSLEWERHWHPYLPPLRDALARLQERNWFARLAVAPLGGRSQISACPLEPHRAA